MLEIIKNFIDFLTTPTISFTLLTVLTPLLFPPTDWFDKVNRKIGLWRIWTNAGGFFLFILITGFFVLGYNDVNFSIVLTKPDNFPIVLMIYTMFFFTWYGMKKSYVNDRRIDKGEKPLEYHDPEDKVLVWPDLVYIEFIALLLFMVFLTIWSVFIGPYFVLTVVPSINGNKSLCTPSLDTSPPTRSVLADILSISSRKTIPLFSVEFFADLIILSCSINLSDSSLSKIS